jgi:hypothetical protein
MVVVMVLVLLVLLVLRAAAWLRASTAADAAVTYKTPRRGHCRGKRSAPCLVARFAYMGLAPRLRVSVVARRRLLEPKSTNIKPIALISCRSFPLS